VAKTSQYVDNTTVQSLKALCRRL